MPGHHLRPEFERDGPHAKGRLRQHHQQNEQRQFEWLAGQCALAPGPRRQQHNHQRQGACEIAMHHLAPAFFDVYRGVGKVPLRMRQLCIGFGHADEAIAAGPVRATQSGVGQTRVGTE